MTYWLNLPASWVLQDVQAILSVILAFLFAGAVFVFVRCFWIQAARDVIFKRRSIPAHDLLSVNTVGEVIDIIWLLRADLFSREYWKIITQSICILLLTIASLMSALLARYSTRAQKLPLPREIVGIGAERTLQSTDSGLTANQSYYALKAANFPADRLLDFLPDQEAQWEYRSDEWANNTWSMNCTYTELEEIPNANVADCSGELLFEVPYLGRFFRDWPDDVWSYGWAGGGLEYNLTMWKDYGIFVHGTWGVDMYSNDLFSIGDCGCPMREMNFKTIWFHLKDAPRSNSSDNSCLFTRGPVGLLEYSTSTCKLVKNADEMTKDELFSSPGAAPDIINDRVVAAAFNMQFGARLVRESMQDLNITTIKGDELIRFYQAQLVAKDTELSRHRNDTRTIHVLIPITQVSLACLIFVCIAGTIVLIGINYYFVFLFRNMENLERTPQSKLDWMLLLIRYMTEQENRKEGISAAILPDFNTGYASSSTGPTASNDYSIVSSNNSQVIPEKRMVTTNRVPEGFSLIESEHGSINGGRNNLRNWPQHSVGANI